jgi:hypothetical protein
MADMQESRGERASADLSRFAGGRLSSAAAKRTRILDDHMFEVADPFALPATFRLQLFAAPGVRPVAVATQTTLEGMSLVNAAEQYASAVWQRLCRSEPEPPIWIERLLMKHDSVAVFRLVTFSAARPYELSSPDWHRRRARALSRDVCR